jgi:hypothetical protein
MNRTENCPSTSSSQPETANDNGEKEEEKTPPAAGGNDPIVSGSAEAEGLWGRWQPCSVSCGIGFQFRERVCANGKPCGKQARTCNAQVSDLYNRKCHHFFIFPLKGIWNFLLLLAQK